MDIDFAVQAGTDLADLDHTDREHRIDSLLVVPDREHLVVVKPVDREHPADTVAAEGRRDHRRDCSHLCYLRWSVVPSLDEEIGFHFAATEVVVDSAELEVADRVLRLGVADRDPMAVPAASSPGWHLGDTRRGRLHPHRRRSRPLRHYCCPALGMSLASWMIPERGPKPFCSTFSWNRLRPGQ